MQLPVFSYCHILKSGMNLYNHPIQYEDFKLKLRRFKCHNFKMILFRHKMYYISFPTPAHVKLNAYARISMLEWYCID